LGGCGGEVERFAHGIGDVLPYFRIFQQGKRCERWRLAGGMIPCRKDDWKEKNCEKISFRF